jgi:hypothetical protein
VSLFRRETSQKETLKELEESSGPGFKVTFFFSKKKNVSEKEKVRKFPAGAFISIFLTV